MKELTSKLQNSIVLGSGMGMNHWEREGLGSKNRLLQYRCKHIRNPTLEMGLFTITDIFDD